MSTPITKASPAPAGHCVVCLSIPKRSSHTLFATATLTRCPKTLEEECIKTRSNRLAELGLTLLKWISSHRGLT